MSLFSFNVPYPFSRQQTIHIAVSISILATGFVSGILSVYAGFVPNTFVDLIKGENQALREFYQQKDEELKKVISDKSLIENELEKASIELESLKERLKCNHDPKNSQTITKSTKQIPIIFNRKINILEHPIVREDGVFEVSFEADGFIFPEETKILSSDPYYSFFHEDKPYHFRLKPAIPFSSERIFMEVFAGEKPEDCN